MPNEKSLKNLIPPKKGEVRNPNGRPKKIEQLDTYLKNVLLEEKQGITAVEAILRKLVSQAIGGNIKAAELLLERAFGKVPQKTDITTGGNPIVRPPITWEDPAEVGE